ncbi:glycosyltransferase family 39 protein [Micrococcus sp.]|uniref:glycosyltransferase family 39 protein n=1 Tax=Micrococcus sp. TaxID=1271 RepID=UPI002A90E89F|nr:glycosyltransferase family 39 protein [Micrococcus sp.]MDY6054804.1 glycosyltransferase family 39 protein [Micrococcus sp.]
MSRTARRTGGEVGVVAALVLAFLALPAFLAARAGALWIPHNDSWAHTRIATTLAEDGVLELIGFNRAAMVGMMAPLGPLGSSIVVQHLFVMLCGAAVLGFSYATARRAHLPLTSSALAAALVGLAPGFALLSTSYMTDVPMMAGIAGALHFGVRFVESGRTGDWALAVLSAAWGVTVREQALAALVAVALVSWLMRRDRRRLIALGTGAALVALAVFEIWRRSHAGDDPPHVGLNPSYAVRSMAMALMSLMFICAPALLASARRPRRLLTWAAAGLAALMGAVMLVLMGSGMLLGNYLAPEGAYEGMLHGQRSTVPAPLMWAAALLAAVALTALATHVRPPHRPRPVSPASWEAAPAVLAGFLVLYLGGTFVQSLSGQAMFERYLYPLVVPVVVLVLCGAHMTAGRWAAAAAAGAVVLSVTSLITAHTWASTGAVWRTAEEIVSQGTDPREVDAGFAWVGHHSQTPLAGEDARTEPVDIWAGQFPDSRQCLIVAMGSPVADGGEVVEVRSYPKYILGGTDQVVIQRLPQCR